jgi:hypothetical protein
MEVGASTLGVAAKVNSTVGCAMSDATLGDVGHTLGVLRGLCGIGAGGIEGLCVCVSWSLVKGVVCCKACNSNC